VRIFSAPSKTKIIEDLSRWALETAKIHPEIIKIGLFGSYSKNNYAVGSDIDLLMIVAKTEENRWFMRECGFDTLTLPLPADLFVYTDVEATRMKKNNGWFQSILKDIIWIFSSSPSQPAGFPLP
jgi:predicted nucleotidyltransferase